MSCINQQLNAARLDVSNTMHVYRFTPPLLLPLCIFAVVTKFLPLSDLPVFEPLQGLKIKKKKWLSTRDQQVSDDASPQCQDGHTLPGKLPLCL